MPCSQSQIFHTIRPYNSNTTTTNWPYFGLPSPKMSTDIYIPTISTSMNAQFSPLAIIGANTVVRTLST